MAFQSIKGIRDTDLDHLFIEMKGIRDTDLDHLFIEMKGTRDTDLDHLFIETGIELWRGTETGTRRGVLLRTGHIEVLIIDEEEIQAMSTGIGKEQNIKPKWKSLLVQQGGWLEEDELKAKGKIYKRTCSRFAEVFFSLINDGDDYLRYGLAHNEAAPEEVRQYDTSVRAAETRYEA